ncbi:Cardiolipin synthase (CMP-forming) [Triplophysa tibetana]|uniref:Cardiolipin synthase (CMP-forming) n=1 Tax=Triplophysa tibetana TaxID=1572043 RepID=A0A5A9NNQ1_9TELE|nr:Cardiolipin synthase (CMP-forming) [Triplophysa tibetana]
MFRAACNNSLLACAKGHVTLHRLSVKPAVRCRFTKISPNTQLENTRSLKTGIIHSCTSFTSSSDGNLHRGRNHSCELLTSVCRSKLNDNHYSLQLLNSRGLTSGFGARASNGFCTKASRKESSQQDQRETDEDERVSSSSPPNNERHFQFKELYENPWTIPNYLCVARILLSPVLGYLIVEQYFHVSLGLFVLAGATDVMDGYIARNWPNQKSALGSALDPLADKILISVLYVSLTYAHLIPVPLTALVICRDVALIAAVFYVRYKTVPAPVTLSKFFNPCYRTARLRPTLISKINTAVQLFLVAASLSAPVFHFTDSVLLQSLWYITAMTTTASAYSYYHYGKKTVEVLNNTK